MIDYAAIAAAGGFGKGTPRVAEKLTKDREEDAAIKRCYATVDARDGRRCVFPGCKRQMAEHHHLTPRSTASKAEKHTPANVTSLCTEHHRWFKAGLVKTSGNATTGLRWSLTALGRAAKIRLPQAAGSRVIAPTPDPDGTRAGGQLSGSRPTSERE